MTAEAYMKPTRCTAENSRKTTHTLHGLSPHEDIGRKPTQDGDGRIWKRKLHITPMFGVIVAQNTETKLILQHTPTFGLNVAASPTNSFSVLKVYLICEPCISILYIKNHTTN